jgi:hypothetical protein
MKNLKLIELLFFGLFVQAPVLCFELKPTCKTFPQVADIVPNPVDSKNGFWVTHKTGELGFCAEASNSQVKIIHKFDVVTPSEMGLLSVAADKNFSKSGKFYIHRNITRKDKFITEVSEWAFENPKQLKAPKQLRVLFEIDQPYNNHNGGSLLLMPNGKLLLGLGDGGAANDPHEYSQNLNSYLGKILEIDLATTDRKENSRVQIFAYGLRNPWKMVAESPDSLIVADVGQNSFEEVARVRRGENHGWNIKEGFSCFRKNPKCGTLQSVDPIHTYGRDQGQSITGGVIVESGVYPVLGPGRHYFFGDFQSGTVWALSLNDPKKVVEVLKTKHAISTFGQLPNGRALIGSFYDGIIFELVP